MAEEFLPKPQTDLPTPEKDLPLHATEPVVVKDDAHEENHGKMPTTKLIIAGAVIALIIAGLAGAFVFGKNSSNKPAELTAVSPSPSAQQIKNSISSYPYIRDGEVFINGKQISNTNNTVQKLVYSENSDTLAYISGVKKTVNSASYLEPQFIYIQKVGGDPKKIYTLIPSSDPNSDYSVQIRDIAFTPDGKELITTTNQLLSIWNLNGELENEISLPKTDEDRGIVFNYSDPRISPDGSKILLEKGYYEGGSNTILDLATKSVKGLGNSSYVIGEYYLGWLPNNKLISFEHDDYTSGDSIKSSLNIYSPQNTKEKSFPINKYLSSYVLDGNQLYIISSDKVGDASSTYTLDVIDTTSGVMKTITTVPVLKDYFPSNMQYSKKLNSIFINLNSGVKGNKNKIYVIDLNSSDPTFNLYQDDASNYYQL